MGPDRKGATKAVRAGYDLPVLAEALLAAARIDPTSYRDWRAVCTWLDEGIESNAMLGAIEKVAARPSYTPPKSLAYFDKPVREWRESE